MALTCFLAMTAAEFAAADALPQHPAWMACHFSPYGTGLSNCPEDFPEGGMLILNDRTPVDGHNPALIASQLEELAQVFSPAAILLDFQRPDISQTAAIAKAVTETLSCPVGVSVQYAEALTCPVFLPPPPPHMPLAKHLAPWVGRELWLEAALDGEQILVTDRGSRLLPFSEDMASGHVENALHCHYHISLSEKEACFTLQRTPEDLPGLFQEAEKLGVRLAVGLYQELGRVFSSILKKPSHS